MKKRCFLGFLSIMFSVFLSLNAFAADCAADHYTNANGECTSCPAYSHSNGGDTPTCTCADWHTVDGSESGATATTDQACQPTGYMVYYLQDASQCETDKFVYADGSGSYENYYALGAAYVGVDLNGKIFDSWAVCGYDPDEGFVLYEGYDPSWYGIYDETVRLYPILTCPTGTYGENCDSCPEDFSDGGTVNTIEGCARDCTKHVPANAVYDNYWAYYNGEQCNYLCKADYYKDDSGACVSCPTGYTAENTTGTDIATQCMKVCQGATEQPANTVPNAYMVGYGTECTYKCAAGYHGDGKTCTICPADSYCPEGATEPIACPENSVPNAATEWEVAGTRCNCWPGYTVGGNASGSTTIYSEGDVCSPATYIVSYHTSTSGGAPSCVYDLNVSRDETVMFWNHTGQEFRYNNQTITCGNPAASKGNGYKVVRWKARATDNSYYTDEPVIADSEIDINWAVSHLSNYRMLNLEPVFGCAAGYYGDGNTCTICPAGSYCPGSTTTSTASKYECPAGSFCPAGAAEPQSCADLENTSGANADRTACVCIENHTEGGYVGGGAETTIGCSKIKYDVTYWATSAGYDGVNPPLFEGDSFEYDEIYLAKTSESVGLTGAAGATLKSWARVGDSSQIYEVGQPIDPTTIGGMGLYLYPYEWQCEEGYRMVNNVCELCQDGPCVNPAPIAPPTCDAGYHVEPSTNKCVRDTLNIVFQNGGSYTHKDLSIFPTNLTVTHGEPVPALSGLETIGPYMLYEEDDDAGIARMGVRNWAFKLDGYDVTAWLADGSVDTYSMGDNPIVSTTLFPAEGDLIVSPVWKTIALKCKPGYYNKGLSDIGKANCAICPRDRNQICPGMTEFTETNVISGIEACGTNSSPNDERTECVCKGGYYGDGTICTKCPDHSTSTEGSDYCTCDTGYTVNGKVNGATTTTDQACSIKTYTVNYYLSSSMPTCIHNVTYANSTVQYWNRDNQGFVYNGVEYCGNPLAAKDEGYKIVAWRPKRSNGSYYDDTVSPDAVINDAWVESHLGSGSMLHLYPEYGCAAGYYGNGDTCTICLEGSYCPGSTTTPMASKYECPNGYTSAAGATEQRKCYLITESGKSVETATAEQTYCPAGSYCPGGVLVYYGDTGGKRSCPTTTHPYSDASSVKIEDCYKNCEDNLKVENGTAYRDADTAPYPTKCPYSKGISDAENPCNIIMKDDGNMFCYESNCRYYQEMLTPGKCTECNVAHAKYYLDNGSNCMVKTCEDGFEPYLNSCLEPKIECKAPFAVKAYQSWDTTYLAYGPCIIEECEPGRHIDANACELDRSPCNIENGVGERKWEDDKWGVCTVVNCQPGFDVNDEKTLCNPCDNYLDNNGDVAVSSYINECEIATCMYQGEKYILEKEKNECSLICTDKEDETGSRHWNEKTQKCERTCNEGFLPW